MKSMTAYAELVAPLPSGQVRLTLRSVNHKSLDVSVRLPVALFALDAALRAEVRGVATRGKLDLGVEVQDEPGLEPHINRPLLRAVAKAWQEDAEWLHLPPLTAEAFFRMPGAWLAPPDGLAERLEAPLLAALRDLLSRWDAGRAKEALRLLPAFRQALKELRRLRSLLAVEADAQAAELPGQYQARLEQVMKDAQLAGQLPAERIVGEAAALAERQDIREELVRLAAHLDDLDERLEAARLEGKSLDVWSQEVLRELNTCGSKCRRIAMTRAVMEAKGILDQIREQAANLE
jgi:uncharacterized protein (TIGR00255 family)